MRDIELLAAHFLGDFFFQTNEEAQKKFNDPAIRMNHVQKYQNCFVPFALLAWQRGEIKFWRGFTGLWLLGLMHYITDSRRWASGEEWPPKPILVDQALHMFQLAIVGRVMRNG